MSEMKPCPFCGGEALELVVPEGLVGCHQCDVWCDNAAAWNRRASPWMPIATAPKDGTPILVWMPTPMLHSHVHAASYHPNIGIIGCHFAFDAPSEPTHWMPLPAPPEAP